VANQKRQKAHTVTQAGLDYAVYNVGRLIHLVDQRVECFFPGRIHRCRRDSHQYDPGGTGNYFTIQCSTGGTASKYQVQILVTAYTQNQGTMRPTRRPPGGDKPKNLGGRLASGINAPAAFYAINKPSGSGGTVQWGPIVVFDSNTWAVQGNMDGWQFPRKFSQGLIGTSSFYPRCTGTPPNDSDGVEYWCNTSLGYLSNIDLATYQALAQAETGVPLPTCINNAANCTPVPRGALHRRGE